jgi:hypothetical protein
MSTTRGSHTATLLTNGKVLVAGGYIDFSFPDYLSSAELYDPNTGVWTNTGSLATARAGHTATLLTNGKVLVAGGTFINGPFTNFTLASVELYDPANGAWTATSSMSTGRTGHTATLLPNGNVLVAGGSAISGAVFSSAELYNPITGKWTLTGSLNAARESHSATLLPNGKVLVAGGGPNPPISSAELYNPASGTWATTGSMSTGRVAQTATLLPNGKALVASGDAGGNTVELYDPAAGVRTNTGPLTVARGGQTATLLPNGKVLVAGGNFLMSAELYDVGLSFVAAWQPLIAPFSPPLGLGTSLVLTGSQFRGISEASGGNNCQDSPSDYPVVQLHSLGNEQTLFLLPTSWSTNSYTSLPVTSFPPGYALLTVFANGIPSTASIMDIEDFSAFQITSILKQGSNILITWTTFSGKTNVLQTTTGSAGGSYSNNFADLSPQIIPLGTGMTITNYLHVGGATVSERYYRVRLVP